MLFFAALSTLDRDEKAIRHPGGPSDIGYIHQGSWRRHLSEREEEEGPLDYGFRCSWSPSLHGGWRNMMSARKYCCQFVSKQTRLSQVECSQF